MVEEVRGRSQFARREPRSARKDLPRSTRKTRTNWFSAIGYRFSATDSSLPAACSLLPATGRSHAFQPVAELVLLRLQIALCVDRRLDLQRDPFRDRQAVAFEAHQLARVVRQQAHGLDPEILQDLDADAVVTLIGLEAETLVGFHRIEPLLLQFVGSYLVGEPDAAPFLVQIQEDAAALMLDARHCGITL